VEGDDTPALSLADVDLDELPVVGDLFAIHGTRALESAADHGCVAIEADVQVGGCVPQELHAAGAGEGERLGFGHDGHVRDGDLEVIGPETVQGIGVASDVSLVPGSFELFELARFGVGRSLCERANGRGEGGDEEQGGGESRKSHGGPRERLAGG